MIKQQTLTGFIAFSLLCPIVMLTASVDTQHEDAAAHQETFACEKNYSFKFPSEWVNSQKIELFTFINPKSDSPKPCVNIAVSSESVDDSVTLDQYFSEVFSEFSGGTLIIKTGEADLNGIPGKWILYNFGQVDKVQLLQYFVIEKGTKYSLTFTAFPEHDFTDYLPEFDKIVSSFRFL